MAIEKVQPLDSKQPYPSLVTGKRACPPEDCGRVYGYYRLLQILGDPTDEEHAEMVEWAGGDLDPERFDAKVVEEILAGMARRRRSKGDPTRRRS